MGPTAGNGRGPRTMFPVHQRLHARLQRPDGDRPVAAKMMGFDPMSLEYIKVAHDDGLGVGDPRDIESSAPTSPGNRGFSVGDNLASRVGDVMVFGL